MNNQENNNSLLMIINMVKRIPQFVKIGITTTCLPYVGCFALIVLIIVMVLSITGGVFEWMGDS